MEDPDLLILLSEADGDADATATGPPKKKGDTDPPADDPPPDDTPPAEVDPPADDDAPPPADDQDPDPDLEDDEDGGTADGAFGSDGQAAVDPVADSIRREELLDEIDELLITARTLVGTARFAAEKVENPKADLTRAAENAAEAARHCDAVLQNFAQLGYDRAAQAVAAIRERVEAVAETIKLTIDGDEDFREPDSDSGVPKRRNDPPSGKPQANAK